MELRYKRSNNLKKKSGGGCNSDLRRAERRRFEYLDLPDTFYRYCLHFMPTVPGPSLILSISPPLRPSAHGGVQNKEKD